MTSISMLPGRLLLVVDPPETRSRRGILYPDVEAVHAAAGRVLLHEPVDLEDLTGRRVIFQKWAGRPFDWGGTTFHVFREGAILATIEEGGKRMTKAELIEEVTKYLESTIPDGDVDFEEVPDVNEFIADLEVEDAEPGEEELEERKAADEPPKAS